MKYLTFGFLLSLLTSCGDDGGPGGTSKYAGVFSDTAVTSFVQTSGIARSNPQKVMELIIPSAYAASGEISCLIGENASFSIDTTIGSVSNTSEVDTTCSNNIDLSIRRGLLESLKDLAIYRTVTDASYKKGLLNMRSSGPNAGPYSAGFVWNAQYQVKTLTDPCYDIYSFDEATGEVEIKPDFISNQGAGTCLCDDANMGDPTHPSYNSQCRTVSASFRFINGTMELDLTGQHNFDDSLSTYERWEECASLADASTCN